MKKDIEDEIKAFGLRFNEDILTFFKKVSGPEKRVVEAMSYSVLNGGKRLRPFLVCKTAELFNIHYETSFFAGASLEFLHSYSLIHDDLPAMDNDDLRRGKPTCHKAFDEATAILAGDGLLTFAFEVLAESPYEENVKIKLISLLSKGAGAFDGMIAGQMLDLYAEKIKNCSDPLGLISRIEEMKTGRLILYAVQAGAVLGKANKEEFEKLSRYARNIGIAFQIADDILDVEGQTQIVGKTLKKDAAQNKVTFVSCYGLDKAKEIEKNLINDAKKEISAFGEKAKVLEDLADFIINRDH